MQISTHLPAMLSMILFSFSLLAPCFVAMAEDTDAVYENTVRRFEEMKREKELTAKKRELSRLESGQGKDGKKLDREQPVQLPVVKTDQGWYQPGSNRNRQLYEQEQRTARMEQRKKEMERLEGDIKGLKKDQKESEEYGKKLEKKMAKQEKRSEKAMKQFAEQNQGQDPSSASQTQPVRPAQSQGERLFDDFQDAK